MKEICSGSFLIRLLSHSAIDCARSNRTGGKVSIDNETTPKESYHLNKLIAFRLNRRYCTHLIIYYGWFKEIIKMSEVFLHEQSTSKYSNNGKVINPMGNLSQSLFVFFFCCTVVRYLSEIDDFDLLCSNSSSISKEIYPIDYTAM